MKYHIDKWMPVLDIDLRTATTADAAAVSKLVAEHTAVLIKGQQLSVEDEVRFARLFPYPESLFSPGDYDYTHCVVPNTDGLIYRVGGDLNENGVPGIGEHVSETGWHHDHPWRSDVKPKLISLHAVKGTAGSTTSLINNVLSYNDLDSATKELLAPLEAVLLRNTSLDSALFQTESDGWQCPTGDIAENYSVPVVYTNKLGVTGGFFPFLQIHTFKGMSREDSKVILKMLKDHITQDKYCYDHNWTDGDMIICDQWHGLHKRQRCETIGTRLLHRAMYDYTE
jgi:alpha-ketoglutarate-dependent taurine dioxygenase